MDAVAEAAYLAGIIDSDGCIGLYRSGRAHIVRVLVKMTDPEAVALLHERYGGTVVYRPPRGLGRRVQMDWSVTAEVAATFLQDVSPYLRIKKTQADVALAFQRERRRRYAVVANSRLSAEELERRENYRCYMHRLNARVE